MAFAWALSGFDFLHIVCARHGQLVSKIPHYSRGCKSLKGELVKPVSQPQGGSREVYTDGSIITGILKLHRQIFKINITGLVQHQEKLSGIPRIHLDMIPYY
ncbi:MAG: hypothetical protein ACNS62_07370 [Candidatus Cyclobacteriaceae bacterium M3_2C_046]